VNSITLVPKAKPAPLPEVEAQEMAHDLDNLLVDELPGLVGEAIFEQAVKDSNFGALS
jgi:hypothetical protein